MTEVNSRLRVFIENNLRDGHIASYDEIHDWLRAFVKEVERRADTGTDFKAIWLAYEQVVRDFGLDGEK